MSVRRRWDLQAVWNPWLSLGIHIDHTDPSVTIHLPGSIIVVGRCKQPGFREEEFCRDELMAEGYRLDRNTWRDMVVGLAKRTGFGRSLPPVPSPHHGQTVCDAMAMKLLDAKHDGEAAS